MKHAFFSMYNNRASGPDYILVEFDQCCWDFVKNDIMRLFGFSPKLTGAKEIQ